jgi:hypothetical protein
VKGGPAGLFVRSELRRRALSYASLAVIVTLGFGAALGALVLAHRTDTAQADHVRANAVNPLVVNPSLNDTAIDRALREMPGVASVHTDDLLLAVVTDLEGGILGDLSSDDATANQQVRGSRDGRYTDVDRPTVSEGRLPTGEREMFVSADYRPKLERILGRHLEVGDQVDMGFIDSIYATPLADPREFVTPMAIEPLTLVGFGHLSDETLPDDLLPRERIIVSADVTRRYACDVELAPDMDEQALFAAMFPGCSTLYRTYSFELEPGTDAGDIREGFAAAADALRGNIPEPALQEGADYFYIPEDRADLDRAVATTTRPTVVALRAFALVAAVATTVIVGLTAARLVRRSDDDQVGLVALGAPRRLRARMVGAAPALGCAVGVSGAVLVAGIVSLAGPIGRVSVLQPHPGWSLPAAVVWPALAVGVAALAACVAVAATLAAGRATRVERRPARVRGLLSLGSARRSPAATVGLRAALGNDRAGRSTAVLAGAVLAVAVIVASVEFGTNLTRLLETPQRYGWVWDLTVITDSGYGNTDVEAVEETLAGRPEVLDHHYYDVDPGGRIAGTSVPVIRSFGDEDTTSFTIAEGRAAREEGEVVLGRETAASLGLGIGDTVSVETDQLEPIDASVVGIAVLPTVGPLAAARTTLGLGALLPVDVEIADAEGSACRRCDGVNPSVIAMRLRDGVDPAALAADLGDRVDTWDLSGTSPIVLTSAVQPPVIANARDLRGVPVALVAILVGAVIVGLATSIAVSVRERRRDLAVLRTLGFWRRQLAATVRWQALAVVGVGVVVGLPLGLVAGRAAWRWYADDLGVAPVVELPLWALAATYAGAVVVGLLAAVRPGRAAARIAPAEALRAQ